MKQMYIVKYSIGSYDDWREVDLFVTEYGEFALEYAAKFNTMLKKWKDFYGNDYKDHFNGRMNYLNSIDKAYIQTIQTR